LNGSENAATAVNGSSGSDQNLPTTKMVSPIVKMVRRRSKAHLAFVAAQPCLVCQRSPGNAHHLKFSQPATLGRKVSDEFTVPLCRDHHHALHRHGNENQLVGDLPDCPNRDCKGAMENESNPRILIERGARTE
jgi:hypothetical protein